MSLVEYYDPDGVYPSLSPLLRAHLPLRNLNWKSPSGPLKSINSLHVDFVPSSENPQSTQAASDSSGVSTNGSQTFDTSKLRRHQIPGLRATPYLKIYLLRCDDKTSYKSSARNDVRAWLERNRLAAQGSKKASKAENHDAAEWLVLHVIFPGTPADEQIRGKKSSGSDHELQKDKTSEKSKWKRTGNTVVDKLRSDFNQLSKTAPDRIAQLRLPAKATKSDDQNAGGSAAKNDNSASREGDWVDLVSKMKMLILNSLNLRVAQYEDDVREREAQRSLPGWNFFTFFILKEGLARAFESVGLLEDALVGYSELAAGLDAYMYDSASETSEKHGDHFAASAGDLQSLLRMFLARNEEDQDDAYTTQTVLGNPLDSSRKPYRELIVSNNISYFDFCSYVVSRRTELLLAQIKAQNRNRQSIDESSGEVRTGAMADARHGSPAVMAEVCQLTAQSIPVLARALRRELFASAETLKQESKVQNVETTIDVIVGAWVFAALEQVLAATKSSSISNLPADFGATPKTNTGAHTTAANNRRKSHAVGAQPLSSTLSAAFLDEDHNLEQKKAKEPFPQQTPGLGDVAAHRGDFLVMQRRTLVKLSLANGFSIISDPLALKSSDSAIKDTDEEEEEDEVEEPPTARHLSGLETHPLGKSLATLQASRSLYQSLTDQAARMYTTANRKNSIRRMIVDLAMLKFAMKDYAAAANHLNRIASEYGDESWISMEMTQLKTYAACLKVLNRRDDHVRILLTVLAKRTRETSRHTEHTVPTTRLDKQTRSIRLSGSPQKFADDILDEVKASSQQLPYDLTLSLTEYFDQVTVDSHITLFEDQDGFRLGLTLKQHLSEVLDIDDIVLSLTSTKSNDDIGISLRKSGPLHIGHGSELLWLSSNTTTHGSYLMDKLTVRIGKLLFVHEPLTKPKVSTPLQLSTSTSDTDVSNMKASPIVCFPRAASLSLGFSAARAMHVGKASFLQVDFSSGSNDIVSAQLILHAATAGLRLYTQDTTVLLGTVSLQETDRPGVIEFGPMEREEKAKLLIPYDTERSHSSLAIRPEVHYETATGSFTYLDSVNVNLRLDIDVNVQEIFKANYMFAKFLLGPAGQVPVSILGALLQNEKCFEVEPVSRSFSPFIISTSNPASVAYKIAPKQEQSSSQSKTLLLTIEYMSIKESLVNIVNHRLNELVQDTTLHAYIHVLRHRFTSDLIKLVPQSAYEEGEATSRLTLPSLQELDWTDTMSALPEQVHSDLTNFLDRWQQNGSTVRLPAPSDDRSATDYETRKLTIDFDVPHIDYLHTASITIPEMSDSAVLHDYIAIVGRPISVQLRVCFTAKWSTRPHGDDDAGTHDFAYDIQSNDDLWLVCGQRRATFRCKEDEVTTFNLSILPLKAGQVFLPTVVVQPAHSNSSEDLEGDGIELREPATCQTDCTSRFTSIVVIDGLRSSTVGIGAEDELTRDLALIESEDRDES
ncbi:MAG: hypothetical protein M1828_003187 [Chrysothrix sp. TS-e1954]|nr:MAG: hypothetical protein M1828_003187 [Chrysothrix sp. TS-e1954]